MKAKMCEKKSLCSLSFMVWWILCFELVYLKLFFKWMNKWVKCHRHKRLTVTQWTCYCDSLELPAHTENWSSLLDESWNLFQTQSRFRLLNHSAKFEARELLRFGTSSRRCCVPELNRLNKLLTETFEFSTEQRLLALHLVRVRRLRLRDSKPEKK